MKTKEYALLGFKSFWFNDKKKDIFYPTKIFKLLQSQFYMGIFDTFKLMLTPSGVKTFIDERTGKENWVDALKNYLIAQMRFR